MIAQVISWFKNIISKIWHLKARVMSVTTVIVREGYPDEHQEDTLRLALDGKMYAVSTSDVGRFVPNMRVKVRRINPHPAYPVELVS